MANPWMKFYTSDWRSDPRLKMCSAGARGVWIEMICLMHEATPYGHLLIHGQTPNEAQLASLTGIPLAELEHYVSELEQMGVFSRTKEGVIYSRKLVRMASRSANMRKNGKQGGNPKLTNGYTKPGYVYAIGRRNDGAVKIGVSVNPRNRIKKIRAQYRGHDLAILGSIWTDDMGTLAGTLHKDLSAKCADGEWFRLTDSDLKRLGFLVDPKGSTKGDPLPQKPEARSQIYEDTNVSSFSCAKSPPSRFQEFWDQYPHRNGAKKGRAKAEARYAQHVKAGVSEQEIIGGAMRYASDRMVIDGYAKDPTTWLNNNGWQDDIEPANHGTHNSGPQQRSSGGFRSGTVDAFAEVARRRAQGGA